MTTFRERYEKRRAEFRQDVANYYNYELSKAHNEGRHLEVAIDAASAYIKEENPEKVIASGAIVASAVVGAIAAIAATVNAPSHILQSSLFAASATLGMSVLAGMVKENISTEQDKVEKLAKSLFDKEIVKLENNNLFSNYRDILFEIANNKGDQEFLKNTMLFSKEFIKEVADSQKMFGSIEKVNPYLFKGIDRVKSMVQEKVEEYNTRKPMA